MKKIIVFVFLLIIISSCGKSQEFQNNVKKYEGEKGNILSDIFIKEETKKEKYSPQIRDIEIKFDKKKEELSVGNILIKKGFPENWDKNLLQYKNEETYINSNVTNYFFFSSQDSKDWIIALYKSNLRQNGWEEIKKDILEEEWFTQNIEFTKDKHFIEINISENIPENLSHLNLKWNFIEIYYK